MKANWVSVISCAFVSAAVGIGAAMAQISGASTAGILLFELGALLLIHSAARTVWILVILVDVVELDDLKQSRDSNTVDPASLFGPS